MRVAVVADARRWLDMRTLGDALAARGGALLDAATGPCDVLLVCGGSPGDAPASGGGGCDVVAVTPASRPDGRVTDVTPPRFHADLAEASILAVLERLYDLHQTERLLRENLPRPQSVVATMLKGKRIVVLAPDRTAFAISRRLRGWGAVILGDVLRGESPGTADPAVLPPCDLVVDASAGAQAQAIGRESIVPVFEPTVELREATSRAVIDFLRSRGAPGRAGHPFNPTHGEQTDDIERRWAA